MQLLRQLQTSDAIIDNLQCNLEKDALISVKDINEAINQQRLHAVELQNEELQQARQALQEAIHDLKFRNDTWHLTLKIVRNAWLKRMTSSM